MESWSRMASGSSPSDLSAGEWALLDPLLPGAQPGGRPRSVTRRRIRNGVVSLLRTGCAWRSVPRESGPWSTVSHSFCRWRRSGRGEGWPAARRERVRRAAGRAPPPSAAIRASQAVTTTEHGGAPGSDGGQQGTGRPRQLLVQTRGRLLTVVVPAATRHAREGAKLVLAGLPRRVPRRRPLWAEPAATGPRLDGIKEQVGGTVAVVERSPRRGGVLTADGQCQRVALPAPFEPVPRRWVVERSFAWLIRNRRLAKDYERKAQTSETLIEVAATRLVLRRLV